MGFVEAAQEGSQVPDALLLMRIMDLQMTPSEEPSSPEEAVRRMKSELLRAAQGSTPRGVSINSIGDSMTMGQLCQALEGGLDRPILDETHLSGTYALNVHSEAVTTREFLRVLCDKLGPVVTPARRDVSMLVARPR